MTLGSVVDALKYGDLRNLAVKDDSQALTNYINQALIPIYTKFQLKTSEQLIPLYDNIVDYTLNDDCMAIEAIYDENGDEFALDDETNRFGIFQVAYDTIQVANPNTGATIAVVYNASPAILQYVDETSLLTIVPIPPQLLEPLLHYTAFRAHSIGGEEGAGGSYYARYEASCNRIKAEGSVRMATVPAQVSLKESISDTATTYQEIDLNT